MAASPTPDTSEIRRKGRQRLIGAIAIVLLAVVFVPMVLDPEPRKERREQSLAIPPKEGASPLPAPEAARAKPEPAVPATPAPLASAPEAPILKAQGAKAPAEPKPASREAAPKASAAPAPRLEGFAVQVGAFRDEAKLAHAREQLAAAKVSHYTERLEAPGGALTRLRAGPFATRDAAEKAAVAIRKAGLEGQVVPLP